MNGVVALDRPLSPPGEQLLKELEGLPGTKGAPLLIVKPDASGNPTWGWGHKDMAAKPGEAKTAAECQEVFDSDTCHARRTVEQKVNVDLNDHEFDALVIFTFNVGVEDFATSTLVRKLNAGDRAGVPEQLRRWVKEKDPTSGKEVVSKGLQARRAAEIALWLTPVPSAATVAAGQVPGAPTAPLVAPQAHAETARTPVPPPQSITASPVGKKLIGAGAISTVVGLAQVAQGLQPTVQAVTGFAHTVAAMPHWLAGGMIATALSLGAWAINDIRKDL